MEILSVPQPFVEQIRNAIKEAGARCPRHGDPGRVVILHECQSQLLQILTAMGHGTATIEIKDGRPTHVYVVQSFLVGKDSLEKVDGLLNLTNK